MAEGLKYWDHIIGNRTGLSMDQIYTLGCSVVFEALSAIEVKGGKDYTSANSELSEAYPDGFKTQGLTGGSIEVRIGNDDEKTFVTLFDDKNPMAIMFREPAKDPISIKDAENVAFAANVACSLVCEIDGENIGLFIEEVRGKYAELLRVS